MTYHSKIIAGGKIVIPADLRRQLGYADGDTLIVERDGNAVVLKSRAQMLTEIQADFKATIKDPFTVGDFLAEKWAETDAENARR